MINYVLFQNKNKESKAFGKWFARAVHQGMAFDEFIRHMAQHHCVYSEGTIRGVLIEMEVCLRELLLEGKAVRFDELGIFSLGIDNRTGGSASAYDFNVKEHIDGVHMNLYLGKRFLARNLKADANFKEQKFYEVDSSVKPEGGENAGGNGGENATGGGNSDNGDNQGGGVFDDSPIDQ